MNIKKLIIGLMICLSVHAQYASGGNIGLSILYRPPLFNCSKSQSNLGPCYNYKMGFTYTNNLPGQSTKNDRVKDGNVLHIFHFIGYWAPVNYDAYIFGPLYRETNIYNNIYTALDITLISMYGYNSSIINWVYSKDSNLGIYDNRKDANNGGWAYLGWEYYINTDHHDRTNPLFKPGDLKPYFTELSLSTFKSPVGTVKEYFDGVSGAGVQILVYWPLHMMDPLYSPYPNRTEVDGFSLPVIRKMITNYSSLYTKNNIKF